MLKSFFSFCFKRYIPKNRFVVFFSSILIISIISGIFLSFSAGVIQQDYFLGDSTDSLVIIQPGVKTPIVSYVPSSIVTTIDSFDGISSISPEIMALVMYHNVPMTLHGITENFLDFFEYKTISGFNLESLFSSNEIGIYAGKNIASSNNLFVGEKYFLYSTVTESYSSFELLGIVQFNSYLDDELFSSLSSLSFFRADNRQSDYSLIRIQFDEEKISKQTLEKYVFSEYSVEIFPFLKNAPNYPLTGLTVYAYSYDDYLVGQSTTDEYGLAKFNLHIGEYRFYTQYSGGIGKKNISVTSNITDKIKIDYSTYNLELEAFHEGSLINNAFFQLITYSGNEIASNFSQNFKLINLPSGIYYLYGQYNDHSIFQTINLNTDHSLKISFSSSIKINVQSPQGQNIHDFNCTITNLASKESEQFIPCNNTIYLARGHYNLTVNNDELGSVSRDFLAETSFGTIVVDVVLGFTQSNFTFIDEYNQSYNDFNVEYRLLSNSTYQFVGKTDSKGQIHLNTAANDILQVKLSNNSFSSEFYYTSLFNQEKTIIIASENTVRINVLNNDLENSDWFNNTNITILLNNQLIQSSPNEQGFLEITIIGEQILNITVTSHSQSKNLLVSSYDQKKVDFDLGNITIDVQTVTFSNHPLSDVEVSIIGSGLTKILSTDSCGCLKIDLPTSDQYSDFFKLYPIKLYDENQIYQTPHYNVAGASQAGGNTEDFFNFFFEISISWEDWKQSFFVPKTYLSNSYDLKLFIPKYIESNILVTDYFGQSISQAIIFIQNDDLPYFSKTFLTTNLNGLASITTYYPDTYNVRVVVNGYDYSTKITLLDSETTEISLPILITNLQGRVTNWNLRIFSSIQAKDQFLDQSTAFLLQISVILITVVAVILSFLIKSSIDYLVAESEKEIFIMFMLGATRKQTIANLFIKFLQYSLIGSILGILFGSLVIQQYANLNSINIIGLTIEPIFSLEGTIFGLLIINAVIMVLLLYKLVKIDIKKKSVSILK
ncbi:MAG: hypothetical protein HeimC3_49630 [Candidatus Heimdallarchaeota archaeon LC_3]|nr:MAG: hypothetical protein HeimC3_49630 [Candidatus Heimdallarchaeota archaeon LC_3]